VGTGALSVSSGNVNECQIFFGIAEHIAKSLYSLKSGLAEAPVDRVYIFY
jgi:hypothetical protein